MVAGRQELFLVPGVDYRLFPGSAAVDAGTAAGAPASDLAGNPRPAGAGWDIGAYELSAVAYGNGAADAGEECGDSGQGCADPCSECRFWMCAALPLVCGDGIRCGAEECESAADCPENRACLGCLWRKPTRVRERHRARGPLAESAERAVFPALRGRGGPSQALAEHRPAGQRLRFVLDGVAGGGGLDVAIPGGALPDGTGWRVSPRGDRWAYTDRAGMHKGIVYVLVRDRSLVEDGRVRVLVKGKNGAISLPRVDGVRIGVLFGAPGECAAVVWNPPGGEPPRCEGNGTRYVCK